MEIKRTIETLLKPPSLKGKLIEEEKESVTIQIGDSLFEIPKEHIENMSKPESESKNIDIELSKDAILVQKTLVRAKEGVLETVTADIFEELPRDIGIFDDCTSYCVCSHECSICTQCITYCTFCPQMAPGCSFTRPRFRVPISRSR